jgi:enoyl-CoA hydratase/carnithine racemase
MEADMNYEEIRFSKEDGIAQITLNVPEKLNPIGQVMIEEISDALKDTAEDEKIKVVIFKAAGKAFSAGHKMEDFGTWYGFTHDKKMRKETQEFKLRRDRKMSEFWRSIYYHPKVTISQVNGLAIGAGLYLSIVTDITIAAESAKFSHAEMRLGHGGTTYILPIEFALIGVKKCRELMFTGEPIDGREAKEIGLVNKVVPDDKLGEEVMRMAKIICLNPADGIAIGKAHMHMVLEAMGMHSTFTSGYILHALFNNLRYQPDEFNFFKSAAEKGLRDASHEKNARYEALGVKKVSSK